MIGELALLAIAGCAVLLVIAGVFALTRWVADSIERGPA